MSGYPASPLDDVNAARAEAQKARERLERSNRDSLRHAEALRDFEFWQAKAAMLGAEVRT